MRAIGAGGRGVSLRAVVVEMRDSSPLVSIGMPAYNGEKFIRKALDALLAQDYQNFELIISDNASTDNTTEVCREYAARDPRIKLHVNEQNQGILANFKAVLYLARGKYFMWAAVDDCWQPAFISTLVEELEAHTDAGAAMCATELVNEDRTSVECVRFTGADDPNRKSHYKMFWAIVSPVKRKYNLFICGLMRTELAQQAFTSLPRSTNGDRIFVATLSLATRFRYADRTLYSRRVHSASATVVNRRRKRSDASEIGPMSETEEAIKLGGMIWRSTIVPRRRKLYIPVGVLGLVLRMIRTRVYRSSVTAKIAHYLNPHKRQSGAN